MKKSRTTDRKPGTRSGKYKRRLHRGVTMFLLGGLGMLDSACLALEEPPNWFRLPSTDAARYFYFSRPEPDAVLHQKLRPRDTLVNIIDAARESVELWCYGLDEPELIEALLRARRRGVELSMIGDADHAYEDALAAGLNIPRRERSGLQHVKLVLVDRRLMFAGTGNFTTSGFFYNNNGFFHLKLDPDTAERISHALSFETAPGTPVDLPFEGRLYFAPRQGRLIQSRLVQAILEAQHSIRFMIFSHTDPVITAALYKKAREGVLVEGIFDDEYSRFEFDPKTEAGRLNHNAGLLPMSLYLDGNFAEFEKRPDEFHGGHLHHKTMIIDHRRVLTGSYNWSASARDRNLETFFDFQDRGVAQVFAREFAVLRERALLQGRAPVAPAPPGQAPFLADGNDVYCPPEGENGAAAFTVFRGKGPYFQALHFKAGDGNRATTLTPFGNRPCYGPDENAKQSAGLPRSKDYALRSAPTDSEATPADWREVDAYEYDLSFSRGTPTARGRPCETQDCFPFRVREIRPDDGYLWLEDEAGDLALEWNDIQIWHRDGFTEPRALDPVAPGFYSFAPVAASGDLLLFAGTQTGRMGFACVRSGKTLDAAPRYVREYLSARVGRWIPCAGED